MIRRSGDKQGAVCVKTAVGLRYEGYTDEAPIINVKGAGPLAEEIVRIARRYGIPVVERSGLGDALFRENLDSQIPADLYEAVAVLLGELEKQEAHRR